MMLRCLAFLSTLGWSALGSAVAADDAPPAASTADAPPAEAGPVDAEPPDPTRVAALFAQLQRGRDIAVLRAEVEAALATEKSRSVTDALRAVDTVLELFQDEGAPLEADWPILVSLLMDAENRERGRQLARVMVMGSHPLLASASGAESPESRYTRGRLVVRAVDLDVTWLAERSEYTSMGALAMPTGMTFTLRRGHIALVSVLDGAGQELRDSDWEAVAAGQLGVSGSADATLRGLRSGKKLGVSEIERVVADHNVRLAASLGLSETRARAIEETSVQMHWTDGIPTCRPRVNLWSSPWVHFSDDIPGIGRICAGEARAGAE